MEADARTSCQHHVFFLLPPTFPQPGWRFLDLSHIVKQTTLINYMTDKTFTHKWRLFMEARSCQLPRTPIISSSIDSRHLYFVATIVMRLYAHFDWEPCLHLVEIGSHPPLTIKLLALCNNSTPAPRVAHTWYRMQDSVVHRGIKTAGRELS